MTQQGVPLLFEKGAPGRQGYVPPPLDVPERSVESLIPAELLRQEAPVLPEMSEMEVVRHFVNLSRRNYAVDVGFYPLGSCTMKYNPKINEVVAQLPGLARIHPYQPESSVQGALALLWSLQRYLGEISGLPYVCLQPAAGAHGELTGLMLMKAYHEERGEGQQRNEVIIPDAAHGTNPASASMCGYRVITVRSDERGGMDLEELRRSVSERTVGLMLTNPNTLGLFDENIKAITDIVHEAGGLLYYDGANANAILGISRPGDMGFDVVHYNVHKTFSTPHGGGGPGAGPIAVIEALEPYLPVPVIVKRDGRYALEYDRPRSIGRVRSFFGNFGVLVKAYSYIRALGPDGLREVSETAVLHANYLMHRLEPYFELPFKRFCKHEFVLSGSRQKEHGVQTLDIAKRLLDYGMHAPTIYFPLIVEEAIMVEPTETEPKEVLDAFVEAMIAIAEEAEKEPEVVKEAPHNTVVSRLDETRAARQPNLRWRPPQT